MLGFVSVWMMADFILDCYQVLVLGFRLSPDLSNVVWRSRGRERRVFETLLGLSDSWSLGSCSESCDVCGKLLSQRLVESLRNKNKSASAS